MIKQYFLPYDEKDNVNYKYIFIFYKIAEYNSNTKRYDTIYYLTAKNLQNLIYTKLSINLSCSLINNLLNNNSYSKFFTVIKEQKLIKLNNNIKNCNKFIVLSNSEIDLMLKQGNNLFAKYLLYLKYYCGYSRNKRIDTTAKQILSALGYSTNSNNYISLLSEYNSILVNNGIISIEKYRDYNGYERNLYTYKLS